MLLKKKYFQKAFGTAVLVDAKQLIKQTIELLKTKTTNKIGIAYRIGLCKIASVGVLVFEKSPLSTKLIQDFEKLNFLRSSYEKYYQGV